MAIAKIAGRGWRAALAVLVALIVVIGLAAVEGTRAAVPILVWAPNRGAPPAGAISGEIRVDVGPPAASLSVAVVDPVEGTRGTVFVLHGIRDRKEAVRGWADMLASAGYRVVLVDLRGHGRSSGDFLSYGVIEARDLTQVLDALDNRGLRMGRVGVMGVSYGAATAIEWAGIDPRIEAVVAIAPFASLRAVVPGYLPFKLPNAFVNHCIDAAAAAAGFDPDCASPVDAISRTRAAVLLIHGEADDRIPWWHSKLIAAAARGPVELVTVPSADHVSIQSADVVANRSLEWFAKYLEAPRASR
jgi:pimeloyl-ACP methyl ester carboxylesterase